MSDDEGVDYNDEHPPRDSERRVQRYERRGGKYDATLRQVAVGVIIAGVLSVLGFAWNGALSNLRETAAVQGKSIEFLQMQVSELRGDMNQMRGTMFRSDGSVNPDYFDAPSKRKP